MIHDAGLRAIPVETDLDVEMLRAIRNATRDGYSEHTAEIGVDEQVAWWRENRGRIRAWLYENALGRIVGFGMLRRAEDGEWVTTVGVWPHYTGRGYGSAITRDIVGRAPGSCRATARLDNPAAMRLHHRDDWEEVGRDGRLAHYRTRPRVPDEVLEDWAEHGWVLT